MNEQQIELGIKQGIKALNSVKGEDYAGIIKPIIWQNHQLKRVHRFLKRHKEQPPAQYIWHVSQHYQQYSSYLAQLHSGNDEVWHDLTGKIENWARSYTKKSGCAFGIADCVQLSSMAIFQARFPYDTSFDPWARIIVRNNCYQFANEATNMLKHEVADQNLLKDIVINGNRVDYLDILDYIEKISSPNRKKLLLLKYFDDLTFPEISSTMGKSIGAVHKLHFDALQELREKLTRGRHG